MKSPLSNRAIAVKVGISHAAVWRWRRGDLRLSAEVEAKVRAVIAAEEARIEADLAALSLGRRVINSKVSELLEVGGIHNVG